MPKPTMLETAMGDFLDKKTLMSLSAVNQFFNKNLKNMRNKIVGTAVIRKSKLPNLSSVIYQRDYQVKFNDVVDAELLKQAIKHANPILSIGVYLHLREITRLPLTLHYNLIQGARSLLVEWEKALLRDNSLLGYYILLLENTYPMGTPLLHEGKKCDWLLKNILCLKIIFELHKPEYEQALIELLQDDKQERALPVTSTIWGNMEPDQEMILEMFSNLFTLDGENHLLFNVAYLNQVLQYILRFVDFDHIEKEHQVGSFFLYQLGLFKAAVQELKENRILSDDEAVNALHSQFIY